MTNSELHSFPPIPSCYCPLVQCKHRALFLLVLVEQQLGWNWDDLKRRFAHQQQCWNWERLKRYHLQKFSRRSIESLDKDREEKFVRLPPLSLGSARFKI